MNELDVIFRKFLYLLFAAATAVVNFSVFSIIILVVLCVYIKTNCLS